MEIDSDELQQYLESALAAIKEGVEGDDQFRIEGNIEFDLAVTNVSEGEGGLKIYVVDASKTSKTEAVSKIHLEVSPDRSDARAANNQTGGGIPDFS